MLPPLDDQITCTVYTNGVKFEEYTFPRVSLSDLVKTQNPFEIIGVQPGVPCKIVLSGNVRGLHTECSSVNYTVTTYQHLNETPDPYVIVQDAQICLNDCLTAIYLWHPDEEDIPLMSLQLRAVKL